MDLKTFIAKTKSVSELFHELESKGDYLNFDTVNELRSEYGLSLIEGVIVDTITDLECQTDEVETEFIEEIKLEDEIYSDESLIEENYEEDSEYIEEHLVEYYADETETVPEQSAKSRIVNKSDEETEYE